MTLPTYIIHLQETGGARPWCALVLRPDGSVAGTSGRCASDAGAERAGRRIAREVAAGAPHEVRIKRPGATPPTAIGPKVLARYRLEPLGERLSLHVGRSFAVWRGPDRVAAIAEDPSLSGGRRVYEDARVRVSFRDLTWSGPHELPQGWGTLEQQCACVRPDGLFYDFDLAGVTSATDALPEVARRVERALVWRRTYAATYPRNPSLETHRAGLVAHGWPTAEVAAAEVVEHPAGVRALVLRGNDEQWHVDIAAGDGKHWVQTDWTREDALAAADRALGEFARLALGCDAADLEAAS